jgi:flagellar biosynthesis component FlhA
MLLAQVDPVVSSSAGAFAEKFGFPALLVIVLLFVLWKLNQGNREEREKRDDRDEKREDLRRAERKEDREAHISALGKHTEVVAQLGASITRVEQKVDNLDRDFLDLKGRVRKFDPSKTDP